MKTLVLKEIRENVKAAALGLIIYGLLLLVLCRGYVISPGNMMQPLGDQNLMWSSAWFCGIFGAVLGWLQIHNERRPDLWAFMMHRPVTRTTIFLGKVTSGVLLYAAAVGLPLLLFAIWARWPGHVAAPFEWRMFRPTAAFILAGLLFYLAGMLTGLRPVRWYASRALPAVAAFAACIGIVVTRHWWDGFLVLFGSGVLLATAVWGSFQTHGYYARQPLFPKLALAVIITVGATLVVCFVAAVLGNLIETPGRQRTWSYYLMMPEGKVARVTRSTGEGGSVTDPEGKPLVNPKTRQPYQISEIQNLARHSNMIVTSAEEQGTPTWIGKDFTRTSRWESSDNAFWYYWPRYGRLVGYDRHTHLFIGSLGPDGFAATLTGAGGRFSSVAGGARTLCSATTLYRVNVEKQTVKPIFSSASDNPILGYAEIHVDTDSWKYVGVATKNSVHLVTADGQPVWQASYGPPNLYSHVDIYVLDAPGDFALWLAPSYWESERTGHKTPTRVEWIGQDRGVVRSAELPELPREGFHLTTEEGLLYSLMPPMAWMIAKWIETRPSDFLPPPVLLTISAVSVVLVCVPVGLWLGRRYRFSAGAQFGWAVFHLLFGLPGVLAMLCVREWPPREPCPKCRRRRMVDRAECEHCGAPFPPPEPNGTEIFAPLGASRAGST
jgi:hypothetical protein